jgi:lipopolysaccharide transport system permease protein
MGARYRNRQVELDAAARRLRISFELENVSEDPWPASAGICLGWQLFDPETGLFIAEGPWKRLGQELAPGQSAAEEVEIVLPRERGRYHVYLSLMQENGGWFYARGWPFLLVDAAVDQGRAELVEVRATTLRSLVWRKRLRSLDKAFIYPALAIWRNRGLIRSMVRRDIAARYRGSFGDVLWSILNPVLLMLTYYFVFGIVLNARFGADPSRAGFALYFLAGMLPWLAFSEAVGRAPSVVLEHRNFVKKLVFPIEILPVNLSVAGLVTQAFALGAYLVFLVVARGTVPPAALWLPALIVPQFLFTLGLAWFLAALGVYVRDLGHILGYLLTLWFFLTPICYPEAALPESALPLLTKNPIFVLVRGFRDILLEGSPPAFGPLWKLWLVSIACCVLGYAWFHKLRKSFADVI